MKSQSGEVEMGTGGSSGSSTTPCSGARWNPTKEQISILENLYKQGMRTPNAEQIQHITTKLKVYGHIEGKNVFYWFQNHKARQRQKQKQESIACVNRFIQYPSQPIFPSPFYQHDVYWLQQNGISFYPQQQPKMFVAGGNSPRTEKVASLGMPRIYDGRHHIYDYLQQGKPNYNLSNTNQETLTLFPLHPTGIIKEGKTRDKLHSLDSISVDSSVYTSNSGSPRVDEDGSSTEKTQFFEFFTSVQGSRGRE